MTKIVLIIGEHTISVQHAVDSTEVLSGDDDVDKVSTYLEKMMVPEGVAGYEKEIDDLTERVLDNYGETIVIRWDEKAKLPDRIRQAKIELASKTHSKDILAARKEIHELALAALQNEKILQGRGQLMLSDKGGLILTIAHTEYPVRLAVDIKE